ncbi:DNA glycosylase [Saccharata proteae CBS 121410]|uniref:DNA glycosylase n=1 Tax=Saccharata proteae CBS 121410 TaxID=1314787 RepID=A0A9P4HWE9_9PEZI|nr:DNA glycosylase [Saccharata proteae CBS 121410]
MVTTRSQNTTSVSASPKPNASIISSVKRRRHHSSNNQPGAVKKTVAHNKIATIPIPSQAYDPAHLPLNLQPASFGLIQEQVCSSLYALLIQAILWNQTRGVQARPILFSLLRLCPTPADLASASHSTLAALLQPIGLHNIRATRLIAFARTWVAARPCKENRYRRLHYPRKGDGSDVGPNEVLDADDARAGWEVAHLPGMGPYALDSFRIFGRDELRGLAGVDGVEEEWRRVVPQDKDLRAYLKWKWRNEGWEWDPQIGSRVRARVSADVDTA